MDRRRTFGAHLMLGIWLGLPLSLITLTGMLATLSPELDALLVPALSCPDALASELPVGFSALERGARQAMPEARLHTLAAPTADGRCAIAMLEAPERVFHHVYLDPRDAHVTGRGDARTPQRFLRDLHRSLLLGENVGLFLVGLFSFVLLGSLLTGLRALGPLRRALTAGPHDGSRRIHRTLAIFLSPFLVLVILTTTWYFAEHVLGLAEVRVTPIPARRDPEIAARLRAGEPTASVDDLLNAAAEAYPGLRPNFVALAVPRRTYVVVTGETDVPYVRDQASQVFLEPFAGRVLSVERADELTLLQRWEHGVDFLHFGTFGGRLSRYGYTLLAALVTTLICAGTLGRLRRRRAAHIDTRPKIDTVAESTSGQ